MKAYPLLTSVTNLAPDSRVYVVREGLVFLYPACIVVDDARSERYALADGPRWTASTWDWAGGGLLVTDLVLGPYRNEPRPARLRALATAIWCNAGRPVEAFDLWWEAINPDADPHLIGAAAAVAARDVMTTSLFRHRVDVIGMPA